MELQTDPIPPVAYLWPVSIDRRRRIAARANGKCEVCRIAAGSFYVRPAVGDLKGEFIRAEFVDGLSCTRNGYLPEPVVLTVGRAGFAKSDEDDQYFCLCQSCYGQIVVGDARANYRPAPQSHPVNLSLPL